MIFRSCWRKRSLTFFRLATRLRLIFIWRWRCWCFRFICWWWRCWCFRFICWWWRWKKFIYHVSFINNKVCSSNIVAYRNFDNFIWKLVTTWSRELFDHVIFRFKSNKACKSILTRNCLRLALSIWVCNRCHTICFKESKYCTSKEITLFIYFTNLKGVKFQFRNINCWWSWWDDLVDKGFLFTVWNNCLDSIWCFVFCDSNCDIHLTFVILDICLISWYDFFRCV